MRIANGAAIAYPPSWIRIHSDPGTASAALLNRRHQFLGYLDLTPLQGDETLANWPRFRTSHDAEEHDRHVRTLAVERDLRFRTGHGTCVRDSYTTPFNTAYVELACLVAGHRATTVVVAAAPPRSWKRLSSLLERAISTLTT